MRDEGKEREPSGCSSHEKKHPEGYPLPSSPIPVPCIPLSRLPGFLDLIDQVALDLIRVERPEHLAKLRVFAHLVAETRIESSDELQRLRHLLLHSKDD